MRKAFLLMLAGALLLGGCAAKMVDFTAVSTKNIQLPQQAAKVVKGKSCVPVAFFKAWGVPDMGTAIDNALQKAGPQYDMLLNGRVYLENQSLGFGRECFEVEGTPFDSRLLKKTWEAKK